jgi:hypothetical protein
LGKAVVIAAGALGALASAAAILQAFFPALVPSQPSPGSVAECQKHHPDADGKPVLQSGKDDHVIYLIQGCRESGLQGVAGDGLWKAELSIYGIPFAGSAEEFTGVEVYATECPALGLNYKYDHMTTVDRYRIVVQNDQTVSGNSDRPESIFSVRGLPANVPDVVKEMAGRRLLVLNNRRNELQVVSCEDFTAAAKPPPPN